MTLTVSPDQLIDLQKGWPNPALLPAPNLRHSATTVLSNPSIANPALLYGPDEGYEPLRTHIAAWLSDFYQPREPVSTQRICITGGASQNLACVLQTFTDPVYTRNVWMVAPTYHLAARIMEDAGFAGRLRGIPEDDEGVNIAVLESGLRAAEETALRYGNTEPSPCYATVPSFIESRTDPAPLSLQKMKPPRPWRKIYKHVIYAVPTFANPSGKIMSLRRREALVRLARQYDALIVTDDVYDFLLWSAKAEGEANFGNRACVPRIVDVDRYLDGGPQDEWGHALSNGSFSKLIGPGARTGWAEASEKVAYGLSQTGSSRSGGAPSHLCAAIIDQMLPTGILQNHIRDVLQPKYAERYHILLSAIHEHLVPLGVTVLAPAAAAGGYFVWIGLPAPLLASDVVHLAETEEKLRLSPGDVFQVPGDQVTDMGFGDHLRLCFAWEEPRHLTEGMRRLARVLNRITRTRV
ncbi:Pyridoxal phosphate-dependent transferase major region subdomain 1 [Penicillium samsonianum]|uniref:Pyridoxal phosphate-dependent transferase major region subdomain 1 n=1 Tax=Penicillium samsonianum TaxID=1882272 RepID=UPI00254916C6|nr:Pyridoxal phosphate-dependent transferase major region subdomain 1 [Penicillium samsonianum]KAJ6137426.1 Pyridoxal phosphate-dependent transferase major region subdomain 1 [Penicillium samsonianum]